MHRTRPPNSSLRKEELDTTNLLTSGADWEEREEHCSLWDDLDDSVISETIEYFEANVKADIVQVCPNEPSKSQAIAKFRTVMSQFIERPWFQTAAFKQHSMITKSSQQLHSEFLELKRKGVFKIIVKLLFQKVHEGTFEENRINKMLDNFVAERLIPDSFKRNVDARRHVYSEIFEQYSQKQKKTIELPPLPDFITCKEEEYFSLLFQHVRSRILTDVKRIYE